MKPEEFEVYVIPPNFMEGGTLFGGLLKTRNIGEGDSICEISHELVLDNWQSVPHTIPQECPFLHQITHQHRKVVRRR